jgi:hypothetical protein
MNVRQAHHLRAVGALEIIFDIKELHMPNHNGKGPAGAGVLTGRRMGRCGGARAMGAGNGRGNGRGLCAGHGLGRGLGWLALGYGREGDASPAANIRSVLEERKAYLSAELARTEALLGEAE